MTWLTPITGILDDSPPAMRAALSVDGEYLVRSHDGVRFRHGSLTTPSLAELRAMPVLKHGNTTCRETVGNVQDLHADHTNAGAFFQVASQFNLLEMIGPSVAPEDGIAGYAGDLTQGPACAIACGAGTIYRNYFVDTGHRRSGVGQNTWYQLDMLADLGHTLGNQNEVLWDMRNGYALPKRGALDQITQKILEADRERLQGLLRVGLHQNTQVTLQGAHHTVHQLYCSALPVAYCDYPAKDWEVFARLVLDAAYEATFRCAAVLAPEKPLYLTLLGGGAFGNRTEWIVGSIARSLDMFADAGLDVRIVSFGDANPAAAPLIRKNDSRIILRGTSSRIKICDHT